MSDLVEDPRLASLPDDIRALLRAEAELRRRPESDWMNDDARFDLTPESIGADRGFYCAGIGEKKKRILAQWLDGLGVRRAWTITGERSAFWKSVTEARAAEERVARAAGRLKQLEEVLSRFGPESKYPEQTPEAIAILRRHLARLEAEDNPSPDLDP
jgi:hypothetical protein